MTRAERAEIVAAVKNLKIAAIVLGRKTDKAELAKQSERVLRFERELYRKLGIMEDG